MAAGFISEKLFKESSNCFLNFLRLQLCLHCYGRRFEMFGYRICFVIDTKEHETDMKQSYHESETFELGNVYAWDQFE